MSVKAILFDLDGTLIDSSPGITRSVVYALKHYGIEENDLEKLKCFIGPPLFNSFEKYYDFPHEKAIEAVDVFRERYNVKGYLECDLYPGVKKCLEDLKSNGYILCLASSKPEVTCKRILEHHEILNYFDCVTGATMDGSIETKEEVLNELFRRCSDIDRDEMILIGDTVFDTEGANKAGIRSIAVSFGFGSAEDMVKSGSLCICDELMKLPQILKGV